MAPADPSGCQVSSAHGHQSCTNTMRKSWASFTMQPLDSKHPLPIATGRQPLSILGLRQSPMTTATMPILHLAYVLLQRWANSTGSVVATWCSGTWKSSSSSPQAQPYYYHPPRFDTQMLTCILGTPGCPSLNIAQVGFSAGLTKVFKRLPN